MTCLSFGASCLGSRGDRKGDAGGEGGTAWRGKAGIILGCGKAPPSRVKLWITVLEVLVGRDGRYVWTGLVVVAGVAAAAAVVLVGVVLEAKTVAVVAVA